MAHNRSATTQMGLYSRGLLTDSTIAVVSGGSGGSWL